MKNQSIKFNTKKVNEKNLEVKKDKQKQLLEKAKNMQQSQLQSKGKHSEINYEEKYNALLGNYKGLKTDNNNLKEKINEFTQRNKTEKNNQLLLQKSNEEIKELKSDVFSKKNAISELNLEILRLKNDLDHVKSENDNLIKKLEDKSELKFQETISNLKREVELQISRVEPLKKFTEKLQSEKDKAVNREVLLEEQIKNLESRFSEVKAKLRSRTKELDQFYETVPISKLVSLLDQRLTLPNVFAFYQIDKLVSKYNKLKIIAKINERKERERRSREKQHKEKMANSKKVNGYIIKNDEDWYFYDLNNKTYLITDSKVGLVPDLPAAAAVYNDGSAYIFYIYFETTNEEEETNDQNKTKIIKKEPSKETKEYDQFGNGLRILIVGSRQKLLYTTELSNHGFEVDWHNPFDDSLNRIVGQIARADIVLVCTSHINHIVMTYINEDDQKVELIQKDTASRIVVRAKYTAIKLGLIN